ncbi:unnamed protein product [Macrosiphum euphorbiae]|uniref:Uncharacterized protein n=1 Tax=Macrosiphum euphorbiae TaxID=13131 RepID=A0AAV0VZX4_9HEMI|nr:unnamed protein product [Macrosiphum euphorbiae]
MSRDSKVPPTLDSLDNRLRDMFDNFALQFDAMSKRLVAFDTRIEELCTRVDDGDTEIRTNFQQLQANINRDFINIQNDLSHQQLCCQETQKTNTLTYHQIQDNVKTLTSRVSMVEGQSARLAALENVVRNPISVSKPLSTTSYPLACSQAPANISYQPPAQTFNNNISAMPQISSKDSQPLLQHSFNNSQPFTQNSFNNLFTSTTITNSLPIQPAAPYHTSVYSAPQHQCTFSNPPSVSVHGTHSLSNISGINLDSTKLPTYNGQLTPIHPEEFLEQAEQYFLTQPPVPDQFKINYVKAKFVDDAQLWHHTLLPPPSVYSEFLLLFRNHFWSTNQQRAIRNELYRPYFHRDNSSLQKHAMDWINRARFLRPPIDQAEMVDQIISHFSFNISVALRGLRIVTTNELIQQLSHLQQAHSPQNTQNSQTASSHQNQNSQQNSFGHNNQNRYPPRQNNYSPRFNSYNRPQTDNTQNQSSPPSPDQATSPSGN